jgi:DNA-binding response OmpR family regulator/two-component sensor histidine kinase
MIKRNGENLLRLINQILDLAKLESKTLEMNYVQGDILAYLRYIAESLHSLANAQNVMLRVESDQAKIIMDYDPDRLLQIVYNLLSNAIKFTPSGGKVMLRADWTNFQNSSNLKLTVTDTGAGIPPAKLPHIFDRFYRADNTGASGTGIGLSLTRELVQALGGKISVESELGKGTTFMVKLPITNKAPFMEQEAALDVMTPDRFPLATAKSSLPAGERPTLLLIEDNPDVVEYLAACLNENYQLDFAYNGRAGIEKAIETIPDLIISDVMMPEKDGFEVVETLKNDERSSHIPIILLTAKATVEDRIAGLRRGADAYLAKPFREEELLVWVEQLITRRRQLQARYARLSAPEPATAELALEDSFMQKLRSVLEANYSNTEFSVDALCREMAMSRTQVHRKLAALTNRSTTEHINAFRLEKARTLLLAGGLNVSEVAFQVGFNDPKYFSRLFSEAYGQTPRELRVQQ